jgi:uncharacterized Tic20 family protein
MDDHPDSIAPWQAAALAGSCLSLLGAFLPWLSVRTPENYVRFSADESVRFQQQGIEFVGETTVLLGALVVALVLFGRRDLITRAAVAVPGLVLAVIPVLFVVEPGMVIRLDQLATPLAAAVEESSGGGTIDYGALDLAIGLYLTLLGGLLVLAGGITELVRSW